MRAVLLCFNWFRVYYDVICVEHVIWKMYGKLAQSIKPLVMQDALDMLLHKDDASTSNRVCSSFFFKYHIIIWTSLSLHAAPFCNQKCDGNQAIALRDSAEQTAEVSNLNGNHHRTAKQNRGIWATLIKTQRTVQIHWDQMSIISCVNCTCNDRKLFSYIG